MHQQGTGGAISLSFSFVGTVESRMFYLEGTQQFLALPYQIEFLPGLCYIFHTVFFN